MHEHVLRSGRRVNPAGEKVLSEPGSALEWTVVVLSYKSQIFAHFIYVDLF